MREYEKVHIFTRGQRVGSLEIIKEVPIEERKNRKNRFFVCKCDCGRISKIVITILMNVENSACSLCRVRAKKVRVKKTTEETRKNQGYRGYFESKQEKRLEELDLLLALKGQKFDDI